MTPQHSLKVRARLSTDTHRGMQRPWAAAGRGTLQHQVPAQGSSTGLQQSKFVFQKRLALMDFSAAIGSWRAQKARRRQVMTGRRAPRAAPLCLQGRGAAWGGGPGTLPWSAQPCQLMQQKLAQTLGCPGRRWVAQNWTPGKQRGFGTDAEANTGTVQAWVSCPASWPGAISAAATGASRADPAHRCPMGLPKRPLEATQRARGSMPTAAVWLQAQLWGRSLAASPGVGQVLEVEERCTRRALTLVLKGARLTAPP